MYDLRRGERFVLIGDWPVPVASRLLGTGVLTLHNLDGMYSYCTDDEGHVYHAPAYADVERVQ
ncbi:hypothetical protein [Xanthomonas phage DES1]|nr:hypothetical protein [Xanthomonas phage DES1]